MDICLTTNTFHLLINKDFSDTLKNIFADLHLIPLKLVPLEKGQTLSELRVQVCNIKYHITVKLN
jgi:hypothetical protein